MLNTTFRAISSIIVVVLLSVTPAMAAADRVVASFRPIHSLVAGVMGEAGAPVLLVDASSSPHDYALKPSQRALLQQANIVFLVDPHFETFLAKVLTDLPAHVRVVPLAQAGGVTVLDHREGGGWEAHDHSGHTHAEPEEGHHHHDHDHHHHDHGHKHDAHHQHHDHADLHIWLDPQNAIAMTRAIARELGKVYPEKQALFDANAAAQITRLEALDAELAEQLTPVQGKPFIVFHDAFQYFERRYGLTAVGSITLKPEAPVSAKRIMDIRQKLTDTKAVCVFREPQFDDKLVTTVIEGTTVKSGTLDPESGQGEAGADLYFNLMRALVANLVACLS